MLLVAADPPRGAGGGRRRGDETRGWYSGGRPAFRRGGREVERVGADGRAGRPDEEERCGLLPVQQVGACLPDSTAVRVRKYIPGTR